MVTLVILDGFGEKKSAYGNAIKNNTPNLDKLKKNFPHTKLFASGSAVGLPDGIMGNSEVGHLTLGSGRVILQDLKLIDNEIDNGKFAENPALIKALAQAEKSGRLHLMGLLSNGRVHSSIEHLFAILEQAKNYKIKEIFIHAILDGRDTGVRDGLKFVKQTEEKLSPNAKIGTIVGRVYAMDRENRYDRIEKAYNMLLGDAKKEKSACEAIEKSYADGIYDEYFEPCIINENSCLKDGDSMIFFNYRTDRAREISYAISLDEFTEFKRKKVDVMLTIMTQYSDKLKHLNTLYPPTPVTDNLSSLISAAGKKQFHVSETTKYAHVTFFFNGGIEKAYEGEERTLIDSVNVKDFSDYPKMRAIEITEAVLDAIASAKYDFILVNYSNTDMLGHTGNFNATKEAVACVDKQAYAVALATLMAGGECIITADHGNAEEMFDKDGNKLTKHTCNPVPFILVGRKNRKKKLKKNKGLSSVAPTVLKLLDMEIPKNYDEPMFD